MGESGIDVTFVSLTLIGYIIDWTFRSERVLTTRKATQPWRESSTRLGGHTKSADVMRGALHLAMSISPNPRCTEKRCVHETVDPGMNSPWKNPRRSSRVSRRKCLGESCTIANNSSPYVWRFPSNYPWRSGWYESYDDNEEDAFVRRSTLYPSGTDFTNHETLVISIFLWLSKELVVVQDFKQQMRRSWGTISPTLKSDSWGFSKIADLRLLYKEGGRDKLLPKSYKPICKI